MFLRMGNTIMKNITRALFAMLFAVPAFAQTPTYNLILKNDALVDSTAYEFDIWIERTGATEFELGTLQPIMTFNTGISAGALTLTLNGGTSSLNASQVPTTMSVTGNELRINPRVPPGAGSGTIVPVSPGLRVGRFRISTTTAFTAQQANIGWKDNTNPFTKVFAYDISDLNVDITDSTGHLNSLLNAGLSPPVITSTTPRPSAIAGTLYRDTLRAQGGSPPLAWSVIGGALPPGLTLASTGISSGTPTTSGTYNFTVKVMDLPENADTAAFSLTVNPGAPTQLEFVQQPTDAVAGVFIAPPPTVRLRDNVGNTVPTAGVAVTISLTTGNGSLTGSLTEITGASGIATFDSLRIDRKGVKILTASSGITSSAASGSFTILNSNATQVRVETAADGSGTIVTPQSVVPLTPLVVYSITRDAFDNFVENVAAGTWTLQNITGGVVAGDLVPSGDNRSATFTGHLAGSAEIRATSPSLTSVHSGTITVTPGTARRLAFTQQPSNGFAGAVITPAVTVQVRDTAGNAVSVQDVSVSMTLTSGTGNLGGTMTQLTNAGGLATFANLTIDAPGLKAITAASPGLTSAVSNSFTLNTYTITATAGPNGTITPSGAIAVNSGASQAFAIAANSGFHIANVLVDGGSIGPVPSHTFTNVTSNHTISASFVPDTVVITVQTSPAGRSVRVDGVLLTAPQVFNWISGSSHTIETDSVQTVGNTRYLYQSWSDAGARSHSVSPSTNTTYTAAFGTQHFLTMTAGTGGIVSPASDWKDAGAVVPISATPNTGYSFTGWTGTGSGSFTGPTNPTSVTMNGPITQSGSFGANTISVTVTTVPAGRQIIVDGLPMTSPQVFNWTATQSHTISVDSVQAGAAGVRYLYSSWSDAGARTHTITPLTDSTVTASFATQYFLTMTAGTGGTAAPASDWKNPGDIVNISATASTGYTFANWTGSGTGSFSGTTNPVNVTMNGPITETASFTPNPISVTITTNPVGRSIIVDDTVYTSPRTFNWLAAQTHTISLDSIQAGAPGTRYLYTSWSDAGARTHAITPLVSGTITASMTTQYFLTMVANAGGTVTPASNWFNAGSTPLITGIPNSGFIFSSWSGIGTGSYTGTTNPQTITVNGPVTQTANFVQPTVNVTIQTNPPGRTFRVDGSSLITNTFTFSHSPGTTHTVATDSLQDQTGASRFIWTSWSDGGARSHTLVYPGKDTTFIVNFTRQFFLTMNAAAGGTTSPPSGFFDTAQVVPISATPNASFSFTGWSGTGTTSYTGPNNPSTVTMHSAISETPSFTLTPINVTVQTNPPGRSFVVDGVTYTGSQAFIWSATATHSLSTTSPQGDTATRHLFANWSDGGTQTHNVSPLTDTTFTVNFSTQHFLTMDAGTGFGSVSPANNWFNAGQTVQISATPNTGYTFASWTGSGASAYTGPNNPQNVTMNSPVRETANWAAGTVPVTVTTIPTGRPIIVDGVVLTSPQSFNWTTGSTHTISTDSIQATATPGLRYRWLSWGDAGARTHTVAPVTGTTYTATFLTQYQLTMAANPGGTVTPPTGWYDSLTSVVITGIPNTGYGFTTWSGIGTGSYSGSANPRSITIGGPITETGNFAQLPVQVTIQTNPPGRTFRVDNGSLLTNTFTFTYSPGDAPHSVSSDSIQAPGPDSRFIWTSWSDGGARNHTIPYPGRDTTFIVNFRKQFFLTMASQSGGSVLPASGYFDSAQTVPISATPSGGNTFTGWVGSGPGSYSGPDNPGSVTMDSAITQTGTFSLSPIAVTVQTNPAGRTFIADGVTYTSPQTFTWSATATHSLSVASPQGDTATRYLFSNWSDGGTQTHSVAPLSDTTFTVNLTTQYFLTTDTGTGFGAVAPAGGWHNAGASVQISATPDPGYTFASWSGVGTGSYTGSDNPATVTMNSPVTETANWAAGTIQVTVTTVPPGRPVTVDGVGYTSPQTFNWTTGSLHAIETDSIQSSGVTGQRYRWLSWNDAGPRSHTVAPTAPATYTATFATQYLLTMAANPGGTVFPPSGWHDAGSSVTITGIPNAGFSFSSWTGLGSGSYSGNANPRDINVNGPVSQTANFVQNPYQVTVRTVPDGRTFRVSGTNYTTLQTFSVPPGNLLSLSIPINPQAGPAGTQYAWANWSDAGTISHNFTPISDTVITATFTTQYFLTMTSGSGGSVSPPSGWNDSGAVVPITATPTAAFTFAGWTGSGAGSYSGPVNPSAVTMNGPITETAAFTLFPITIRLRSVPPGRTVVVDSVPYVTPQDVIWTSGTTHSLAADSIQDGASGVRHLWTGWNDGKARTHPVTGLSDTTFTAYFRDQYYLTTSAGPGGTAAPPSAWHDSGASVPITAAPAAGYGFTGWTGTGTGSYTGTNNPAAVTMLSPVSEAASFSLNTISVTVRTNPDGHPVLVDDTLYASPKTFLWPAGSSHTISTDSAHAPSGGTRLAWSAWSDAGARTHTIAPVTDSTFTATLGTQYYLTMNTNPGGSVTPPSGWYNNAQTVTITATPSSGYTFASWSGSGTGSYSGLINPRNITMGGPISQTANFNQNTVLITVQTNPPGRSFRIDGTSYTTINTFSFLPGTSHTFSADSIQPGVNGRRYVWTSWSDSGARSHNFVAPAGDSSVVVNFGLQYELVTFANPLAAGTIQPPGQSYFNVGDTASVLALSNVGYAFTDWTGSVNSTANPVPVVMDTAKILVANYSPAATIVIRSNPPGRTVLVDNFATVTPDTFSWLMNSTHTVGSMTPQSGEIATQHVFTSWSDGGAISHSVTVTGDLTLTANFQTQHYLFIGSQGAGTVLPAEGWFNEGVTVEISAAPDSEYEFIEWNGSGPGGYSGFSNPAMLTMSGWATQIASFGHALPPPSLTGIPDDATDQPIRPRISWNRYPGADTYIVQVSTDSLFSPASNIVDSSGITDSTLLLPVLGNIRQYFWRVKARVGGDITRFSEVRDFTTVGATIAVTSPALNWGTGYTYDISWSAQNLSGKVNVLLSTDNGLTFTVIDSALAGSTTRYSVPLLQPPSNFCVIRVVSASNGQFYGDGRSFAILPGALPLVIPVSATIPFPAEPTISTFYRLVSHPGVVDTTIRLSALIPGVHPKDWRMFSDNGRPDNYLNEMGPTSNFETGRGYWLLKRNDLGISANMVTPVLETNNAAYSIRLRSGWNIIANPFDRPGSWSSILALNGLPPTTQLYGYEGSYQPAALLYPFRGYYFFNSTNLTELKIAYPFGTAIPSAAARHVEWELRIEYGSEVNDDPANFIGVAAAASEGLDELESHKPPIFLDQGFLYFKRPEWDRDYDLFSTDFRPAIGEGQTWEFEVSRQYGTTGTLRFDGLDAIPAEYEVYLVNRYNSVPVNLRQNPEYAFTSVSTTMPFRILVGTGGYVEREIAAEVPSDYALEQNFPNPFNSTTSISVKLPRDAKIRLDVYSVLGQRVATIADGEYGGGTHTFLWHGTDDRGMPVSSGVYLYRLLDSGTPVAAHKMILAK